MKNVGELLRKIPDRPQIPLPNYLLDLADESDGKGSSLYLNEVDSFIQEVWQEMVQNNWRTLNVRKFIPGNLGIHPMGFYSYKNGKKGISIQMLYKLLELWKEKCKKTRENFTKKWDEVFEMDFTVSGVGKVKKAKLPKYITPKLSYLTGWICGDGHLNNHCNHYLIKISEKSTDQLNLILKPLFEELFGVKPPIFKRFQNGHALQIGSKPIFRFLTQVLKIKIGKVPNFTKKMDNVNKRYFLCGLFDAEGHVGETYLDSRIVVSQANKQFLLRISSLFVDLDIKFNKPYLHKTILGEWYTIDIRRKMEILKFANEIGSFHIDKSKKLERLVKAINENWSR